MILAIASCPNPPLLLPGATGTAVAEVEELRAACLGAIGSLLTVSAATVLILGSCQNQEEPEQALSLQVGRALLSQAGCGADVVVSEVLLPADLPPQDCVRRGQELAAAETGYAVLVMADGSARRTEKAPGYFDARSEPFDAQIEAALRSGNPEGLLELDPQLATDLLVAGRPTWQVMAAAVATSSPGLNWRVQPWYFGAPFGVFYPVVTWMPA